MKQSIGIDANEANVDSRVGTGQYTFQILSEWYTSKHYDFHLYLRDKPRADMPRERPGWHYHLIGPQKAWTRIALPLRLLLDPPRTAFWSPAHYLPPYTKGRGVVTVHDLAYELYPELFLPSDLYKLKNWTRRAVAQASRVIAVSRATKHDLVRMYGVDEAKITVIHNGYDAHLFESKGRVSTSVLTRHSLKSKDYILFMGTVQPRKNVVRLIQAFQLLREKGYTGKLVLAGRIGWMAEETLQAMRSTRDAKNIIMTGYVSDDSRSALYRHADVFVLPSLYEGFGLPALEAMASGCPVAVADNSSLPEVVGNAGVYFNAVDPAGMAAAILDAKKKRSELIKKGAARAHQFSWEKCASKTLKVLTSGE